MNMSKAQANKIINTLFAAIPDIYHGYRRMADKMFDLESSAEKQHRNSRGSVQGFSVIQAAKYFTIVHLMEGRDSTFKIVDMLDIRHEALMGQAYATRYAVELAEWFSLVASSEFAEIDYCEMMK